MFPILVFSVPFKESTYPYIINVKLIFTLDCLTDEKLTEMKLFYEAPICMLVDNGESVGKGVYTCVHKQITEVKGINVSGFVFKEKENCTDEMEDFLNYMDSLDEHIDIFLINKFSIFNQETVQQLVSIMKKKKIKYLFFGHKEEKGLRSSDRTLVPVNQFYTFIYTDCSNQTGIDEFNI
ncbi:hypothetical protein ACFVR2_17735 [Gottfriedia sp. NPDC057991]|uniref:hypothetical protein n=1 Tax=Gottfriedia sp. NPDC057991 TaxID=3346298 RepID=UPI0036D76D6F